MREETFHISIFVTGTGQYLVRLLHWRHDVELRDQMVARVKAGRSETAGLGPKLRPRGVGPGAAFIPTLYTNVHYQLIYPV